MKKSFDLLFGLLLISSFNLLAFFVFLPNFDNNCRVNIVRDNAIDYNVIYCGTFHELFVPGLVIIQFIFFLPITHIPHFGLSHTK